jgi:hypothetical protein
LRVVLARITFLNYKLLVLAGLVCGFGFTPAKSQSITLPTQEIELLGAVGNWLVWADNAISQHPKQKDAEVEVASQVKGNKFLSKHNATMVILPNNERARFKLSLQGLSKSECRQFIAMAARDPAIFSGVELDDVLVKGYSSAGCHGNASVSLLRI